MTVTQPHPITRDLDVPPEGPAASEWQVAVAIARREASRLARASVLPLLILMLMGGTSSNPDILDVRPASFNSPFTYLLLAATTLVVSHRAVTRSRRDGSEELLNTTPAPPRARTGGHLLAVLAPTAMAALVGLVLAWYMTQTITVGSFVPSELAVGPLLVAGAGCLGVLLARMWPSASPRTSPASPSQLWSSPSAKHGSPAPGSGGWRSGSRGRCGGSVPGTPPPTSSTCSA